MPHPGAERREAFRLAMVAMTERMISRDILNRLLHEQTRAAYDDGLEEGRRQGHRQGYQRGAADILCLILQQRFGPLDDALRNWLHCLSQDQLQAIAQNLPHISHLDQVPHSLQPPAS